MRFFRKSILAKILFVFFVILFISLAGITTYDSISTKKRVLETAKETQRLLSNQIEQSAEVLFASTEMTLQGISRENSITNILVADKYKNVIYKDFKRYEDSNNFIKSLMMVTKDNQIFQSSKFLNGDSNFKAEDLSWFKKAVENRGRVVYTSPFVNEKTEEREMILAKTVNKDGNVIGVVAAVISGDLIQELLQEVRIGKTGYAFSVDSAGIVTAHNDKEKIALNFSEEVFFKEMLDKSDGYIEYEINGIKKFLYFYNNPRTNWKFAVTMDRKEVNDEMKADIIKNLIILIVTLIIGTYLSEKIVQSVVRPIRRLENSMEEIEKNGNLAIKLEVEYEDEVGLLTRCFNHMIARIRELVISVSSASTTLVELSSEFTCVCQNNAASAQQVSVSLEEISQGATNQHEQSDEILKETMEFADYINGIAENAKKVFKGAKESQKLNKNGVIEVNLLHKISKENVEYVDKVTEEILGLHEKSQAVVKITENIEKIAKQTNMISLNARIEAAKAGAFGESFSVVANEVQRLADETKNLAGSIHHYIDEMIDQVKITTEIIENTKEISHRQFAVMLETQDIFKDIEKSSNMIVDEVEELNMSIDKMNIKKENILDGIGNIVAVTQQSSDLVKQVSSAVQVQTESIDQVSENSEELMNMAKELEEKISVFSSQNHIETSLNCTRLKKKIKFLNKLRGRLKDIDLKKLFKFIDLKKLNGFKLEIRKIRLSQFKLSKLSSKPTKK